MCQKFIQITVKKSYKKGHTIVRPHKIIVFFAYHMNPLSFRRARKVLETSVLTDSG